MTPKPHDLLASAIDERRGELGLSLREVAELAGVTAETLRAVRKGSNEPSSLTKHGIERALRWEPGSVASVLNGGGPTAREPRAVTGTASETLTFQSHAAGTVTSKQDEDPKIQRAMELLAEATAMLEEIRQERKRGA